MKPQRKITYFVKGYLVVGLVASFVENVWGAIRGGPSAFVWTGSLIDNGILFVWWFLIPILTWPVDLFWAVYHKVL